MQSCAICNWDKNTDKTEKSRITRQDVSKHVAHLTLQQYIEGIPYTTFDETERVPLLTRFVAYKHSRQDLALFITLFIDCDCCSRHTGNDELSDRSCVYGCKLCDGVSFQSEQDDAEQDHSHFPSATGPCGCDCRHNLRTFTDSLQFLLMT